MNPKDIKDWLLLGGMIVGFVITSTIAYQKVVTKINGLGGRVKKVEDGCAQTTGQMGRLEREIAEYRRDALDAVGQMGRIEKSVEDLREEIQQGNLNVGSQLSEIGRSIAAMDKNVSNRLVRVETLAKVEQKLGPMPKDET